LAESAFGSFLSGVGGGATVAIIIRAYDQYSSELKKADANVGKASSKMSASLAGVALAAAGTGVALFRLSAEASRYSDVQKSFNTLVGGNGVDALNGLEQATQSTVSQLDLMRNANLLLQNVQGITAEQMNTIARAAVPLSQAVGITVTEAYNRLAAGIAKGETELLDELGLKLDATVANRKYAESLGKSVTELTAQERATAALINILPQLDKRMKELGDNTESTYLKTQKLTTAWENFKVQLGDTISPATGWVSDRLTEALEGYTWALSGFSNDRLPAAESSFVRQAETAEELRATTEAIAAGTDRRTEAVQEQYGYEREITRELKKQLDYSNRTILNLYSKKKRLPSDDPSRAVVVGKDELGRDLYGRAGPSNIKLNDFIMRPGGLPVSFSDEDTIIGMKNPGKMSGGKVVNIYIDSVQGLNPDAVAYALERKVLNSIVS
jgi:hypothetical protein